MPADTQQTTREGLGRAICALAGRDPDRRIQGVTGRWWAAWDYAALHEAPKLEAALAAHGLRIVKEPANAK